MVVGKWVRRRGRRACTHNPVVMSALRLRVLVVLLVVLLVLVIVGLARWYLGQSSSALAGSDCIS